MATAHHHLLAFSLFLVRSRMRTEILYICSCALCGIVFQSNVQSMLRCCRVVFHSQLEAGNSQLVSCNYNLCVC